MIVVTGYPRSGTSLMMGMLAVAGVPIYCDDHRWGKSFETTNALRLPNNHEWLQEVEKSGAAVKILHPTICRPPNGYDYLFIHMVRNVQEQALSGAKLLRRSSGEQIDVKDAARKIRQKRADCRRLLKTLGEVIEVRFEDQIRGRIDPVAERLSLDPGKMRSIIIPRQPECLPGLLESERMYQRT